MSEQDRYLDNGDGTITDTQHGLMWKQSDSMIDLEKWVNYQDGVDYVRKISEEQFAGYDDWRLPTREEMSTLFDKSFSNTDKFGKTIHISDRFASGGGFSIIAKMVDGRIRTFVLNLRTGEFDHPDGLWTLSESARAVRKFSTHEK